MALAMIGQALISASVEILINTIASREFRDLFSKRKLNVSLLDELKTKLLALNAVLNDAEEKQINDLAVKAWLDELKDAVLDAEDLLDEINTDSLGCKVNGKSKNFTIKVRSCLSPPSHEFYKRINSKLEAISLRLEYFVRQKDILGLRSVSRRVSFGAITDSLAETVVVAREDDKERLLNMLLSDDDDPLSKNIGVITILGMGGLGKTTLAQFLYNDPEVQKHFDLRAWAYVAEEDFDIFRITKNLVESFTSKSSNSTNIDVLRVELKNSIKDKKFLLVLDDLWNEKYNDWHRLISPFSNGKIGSKIVVTTRQPRVAEFTHTHNFPIYELKLLTDEDCWCILAKHAFGNEGYEKYPILEEIGRKIAKKCGGLPLAAKTLGGLLRSNFDAKEWNRILKSNLWAHDDVLPALLISYLHLPPHLKRCFAYCSIFPRQHLLDKKELILLWMAEGFLQQSHGEKAMELVGEDCFSELLSRSLIQKDEVVKDNFRMHELVYDLARLVSGKSSCCFEGNEIHKMVRYLSFQRDKYDVFQKFGSFYDIKSLRTFLPRSLHQLDCYLTMKVLHDLLPKLRCLRILSLSRYKNVAKLPDTIGNLVHLRYLNLSYTSIRWLPAETFTLYNLQTLLLSHCKFLVQLPQQIGNLLNLRHLDVSDTNLEEMPTQISRLQNLHSLTTFVVGRQKDGLKILELRNFPYLQGKLCISKLQNVVDPMDAFLANLKNKGKIEELMLEWGSNPLDSQTERAVLENLQPSTNLKKLNIKYYGGSSFPNWLGDSSFSYIVVLGVSDCNHCLSLPPFGQLPSLKELSVKRLRMVTTVGHEFYHSNLYSPLFQPFPSLESLEFEDMPNWQDWLPYEGEGINSPFPFLRSLHLCKCPKLRGNVPSHLPSLTEVHILECNQLEAKSSNLHWNPSIEAIHIREGGKGLLSLLDKFSYSELSIEKCDSLQSLPGIILGANCLQELTLKNISSFISFPSDALPTSLRSLEIWDCENLEFLSHETWHKYTSLEKLGIWNSSHSLTSFPLGSFPSLQELYICFSPKLEAITTEGVSPKLVDFNVTDCVKLKALPEHSALPALEHLGLSGLPELVSLSPGCLPSSLRSLSVDLRLLSYMSKREIGLMFQRLSSLSHLYALGFEDQDIVNVMLKERLLPTSLVFLGLYHFNGFKFIEGNGLQHLNSLHQLHIDHCPSLVSLPENQLPSSLSVLNMEKCPLLEARYRNRKGKHWSKISHIPAIKINEEVTI